LILFKKEEISMEFTKSEAKQWARENYKGLECIIMPSFTPDLAELDEESIRWDVQYHISQGWFSILCAIESSGMTNEERKKFLEIVCDEAKGKIHVSMAMLVDTVKGDVELLQHFEKVGGSHVLFGHPVQYYPKSEEEIYQLFKAICKITNLAIDLTSTDKYNFERFHISKYNPKLLERMANIENVVAMKVGNMDAGFIADCFRLCGDQILVNVPIETYWPITIPIYGQQWAGSGNYDIYQTPDNHRIVKHFNLLGEGKLDQAMDMYWQFAPARNTFVDQLGWLGSAGCYPFVLFKYYQWLVGGNGGMLRQPGHRLHEHEKEIIKTAMKATGLKIREAPEEEFYVGRVNYAKGARLKKYEVF
jgi:4-hydroxy-tetrahydrodipicolinate synthase